MSKIANQLKERNLIEKKGFKSGDAVYYYDNEGNTIPATVVNINTARVKIKGNFFDGDREVYVKAKNLEYQEDENYKDCTMEEIIKIMIKKRFPIKDMIKELQYLQVKKGYKESSDKDWLEYICKFLPDAKL